MAKQTDSQLYLLVNKNKEKAGYLPYGEYALGEFTISKENILYLNKLNRLYFKLIYGANNEVTQFIRKILNVEYITNKNFLSLTSVKNDKILVMNDYFESPIFFDAYRNDILKQFNFAKIDVKKLQPLLTQVSLKNSACIHVRRGDMLLFSSRIASIDFQKQAIKLANMLIEKPRFFIFSDDIPMVKQELEGEQNLEFIDGYSSMEDLYIMSKCANNIITKSSFSWWAAYLNSNNGLVIAPYNAYNEDYFLTFREEDRPMIRYLVDKYYPKKWLLLDEEDFSIYTGDRKKLRICPGASDFHANLCYQN